MNYRDAYTLGDARPGLGEAHVQDQRSNSKHVKASSHFLLSYSVPVLDVVATRYYFKHALSSGERDSHHIRSFSLRKKTFFLKIVNIL